MNHKNAISATDLLLSTICPVDSHVATTSVNSVSNKSSKVNSMLFFVSTAKKPFQEMEHNYLSMKISDFKYTKTRYSLFLPLNWPEKK